MVILFEHGLTTDPASFRSVGVPKGPLATIGVVVTAWVVALASRYVLGLSGETALLLGAVVSSTDAAAVFAALRGESLPRRTRWLLQLESGNERPGCCEVDGGIVEVWRADPTRVDWVSFVVLQMVGGSARGSGGSVTVRPRSIARLASVWATR